MPLFMPLLPDTLPRYMQKLFAYVVLKPVPDLLGPK